MEYPLLPVTPLKISYTPFSIRSRKRTPQTVYSKGLREKHVEDGDLDAHLHGYCDLPDSWKELKHLDGRPYFFHETLQIVTYDNMRDLDTRNEIENIHQSLQHLCKCVGLTITKEQEFYIGLYPRGYYCIDYDLDQVFWLQNVALSMLAPHYNAKQRSHVSFGEYYWIHKEHLAYLSFAD
ncbi:hypothetical protein H0H92_008348 [Tricholoma furcatifolium]|nr:hypothetical protein H0H92_008348 [Tricholoma furcatifolium]